VVSKSTSASQATAKANAQSAAMAIRVSLSNSDSGFAPRIARPLVAPGSLLEPVDAALVDLLKCLVVFVKRVPGEAPPVALAVGRAVRPFANGPPIRTLGTSENPHPIEAYFP